MSDRDLLAIVREDVSRKFDIVLEGIDGLNQKMERYRDEANERFERVEAAIRFTSVDLREKIGKVEERLTGVEDKLDAVADDVAAHRADTESHTLYRVKEEG